MSTILLSEILLTVIALVNTMSSDSTGLCQKSKVLWVSVIVSARGADKSRV